MNDAWHLLTDPTAWPALAGAWVLGLAVLGLTALHEWRNR